MSGPRALPALVVFFLVAASCTSGETGVSTEPRPSPTSTFLPPRSITTVAPEAEITATSLGLAGLSFGDFLEESYSLLLIRDPQALTSLGIAERFSMRNNVLTDMSDGFIRETQAIEVVILEELRSFDREMLVSSDQVSYDVYEWYLDQQVRGHRFIYHEWPVHHFVNSYNFNFLVFLTEEHTIDDLEDAEDYISRLSQILRQVGQVIDGLERREELGIVPPATIVDWTVGALASDLGGTTRAERVAVVRLPLYTTFEERLDRVPALTALERESLLAQALIAIEESFVPAWLDLREYMSSLREKASTDPGVWRLPDGDAFYRHLLRDHTSTELTPGEIHQIGLRQVERIQGELRAAFDALGYPSEEPIASSLDRAAVEAGFLSGSSPEGRDEVLATHHGLIEEAKRVARPLFGVWPEAEMAVVADQGGGGFYVPGSADGSRPGAFRAGAGRRVRLINLPTINYHEAVPGHHTQIAIAQELDLPSFRRFIQYNAFAEGWALYAERLASEMGLYQDNPHGDIGRLELELLRAVRLVVDTGLHSERWTQAEAHSYMDRVIPNWTFEVERYMVLPGQATGYMIGMQEILRLREDARAALGDEFDIADFHTAVLGSGSLPLTILSQTVPDHLLAGE